MEEADKLKEAIRVKDDEVSFQRVHVAKLRQNISLISEKIPQLPPNQEGARAKSWWQFRR
jgi:hypothetical protein